MCVADVCVAGVCVLLVWVKNADFGKTGPNKKYFLEEE